MSLETLNNQLDVVEQNAQVLPEIINEMLKDADFEETLLLATAVNAKGSSLLACGFNPVATAEKSTRRLPIQPLLRDRWRFL